ncbi:histone H2A.Z-specific chaperone CHZ1-like [Cryptomeria japonica]|uniref:histone H2A.Z-specific chaperone CHZ1-like n=1 Tax=Cryptomeria japonica TaxID=3369 RepID=UPI0027DAB359|nr:histone H2A.Z-specific chaperone CHZ1-like [Cryptomeria japonica]
MAEEKKAEEAPTTEQSVDMQPPSVKEHHVESQLPLVTSTPQKEQTKSGKEKPEEKSVEKKEKEEKIDNKDQEKKNKTLIDDGDEDSVSIKGPIDMDNLSSFELIEIDTSMQSHTHKKRLKE